MYTRIPFLLFLLLVLVGAEQSSSLAGDDIHVDEQVVCENDEIRRQHQQSDESLQKKEQLGTTNSGQTIEDSDPTTDANATRSPPIFRDDDFYIDSLVNPVLSVHAKPTRVLVISDQCRITKEVLKNLKVKNVTMFDIPEHPRDDENTDEYSMGCDDIISNRVKFFNFFDSMEWFVDRYNGNSNNPNTNKKFPKFKVVIVDPSIDMELIMQRPRIREFVEALYKSLQNDGLLVARAGWKDTIRRPPNMLGETKNWNILTETFDELGADLVTDYQMPARKEKSYEETSTTIYYNFAVVMKKDGPFEERWNDYWITTGRLENNVAL